MSRVENEHENRVRDMHEKEYAEATVKFNVIGDTGPGDVRIVEAHAGTGSRYVVAVSRLPEMVAPREGGTVLVSVVWPWQDCKVMQDTGYLSESYVAEHLSGGRAFSGRLSGGDMAGLVLTVRRALERDDV